VASIALNDPDAACAEARRAISDLGACGVQVFTNVNGAPLTSPEFLPLFDLIAEYDRPMWLHPARGSDFADYRTETSSKFEIWWTFGWPYETSVTMARIVFAGLFDRHPGLKIITHHMGGMIPYFEGRVGHGWDQLGTRTRMSITRPCSRRCSAGHSTTSGCSTPTRRSSAPRPRPPAG
jgi:Predicted metal-dependent hydrolase of the TIM-barrel fold